MQQTASKNRLAVYGVLTALVYLIAIIFYWKGPDAHSRTGRELFAWFCCISLLILFWKGFREVQATTPPPTATIVKFAFVLSFLAFQIFPFHSTDVFGYINRGWEQVHYGLNPYAYRLADVPNWRADPMMTEHWIYNPNPYGFLFSLLTRFICWLGGGNWLLTVALFKAVNALSYALVGFVIWLIGKRWPSIKPTSALYLFLWNPLILMHEIANGHNGLFTALLVILAIYCAILRRDFWIIPLLTAAGLLKFGPFVLLPLALIFVVKRSGWRIAVLSGLVALGLAAVTAFPYLRGLQFSRLVDIQDNATLIDNSLHSLLIHIFENIAHLFPVIGHLHAAVNTAIKATLRLGFLCFVFLQCWRIPRDFTVQIFARKSLLIMFVLVVVVSSKFNAWYLAMILPLALVAEERDWLRELVVVISGAELLSLTFFKQAYMLNYFAMVIIPTWIIFRRRQTARQPIKEAAPIARPTTSAA